jgi:hypothetical protein
MEKIRQVLLTESIGAVAIGFLLAQAVIAFVGAFVTTGEFLWMNRNASHSVFYNQPRTFSWAALIAPLVSAGLYSIAAYLLMRWLYMQPSTDMLSETAVGEPDRVDDEREHN